MQMNKRKTIINNFGFSLIEMLLVLTIISAIIMTGMHYYQQKVIQDRIDKTTLDMQQILTAAMTFYVAKGVWPDGTPGGAPIQHILDCLAGSGYSSGGVTCDLPLLPSSKPRSPWFALTGGNLQNYSVSYGTIPNDPKFYVWVTLGSTQYTKGTNTLYAQMIASKMPFGYTSSDTAAPPGNDQAKFACGTKSTQCSAVASVLPPGQTLFNAGSVNFAGTYRHGGCIPAPTCPIDPGTNLPLVAQVFVVPVSISGFSSPVTVPGTPKLSPITSFTAYVRPNFATDKVTIPIASPPNCVAPQTPTSPVPCTASGDRAGTLYWRACVDIQTQQGSSALVGSRFGAYVFVAAFTRCALATEPTGGGVSMYETP